MTRKRVRSHKKARLKAGSHARRTMLAVLGGLMVLGGMLAWLAPGMFSFQQTGAKVAVPQADPGEPSSPAKIADKLSSVKLNLAPSPAPAITPGAGQTDAHTITLPILMYHHMVVDLDTQLTLLEQRGYSVVGMDEAVAGLEGRRPLPLKPVVITFDDGFADQMQAFAVLRKHNMKATFYIINGGAASRWCIGAGRRYGDPLQPKEGCGDAYLTWDQVRTLDQSGLITIGGHTLDHEALPTLSPAEQARQITQSKIGIEAELGHPIRHFAYPYGAFNTETVRLAEAAGYESAVTTIPGTAQQYIYELERVRST